MKVDRSAMHRRAQRAEADRDVARQIAVYWERAFRSAVRDWKERVDRQTATGIEAYRSRVAARIMHGSFLLVIFVAFVMLTACATTSEPRIEVREVKVPVSVPCGADPGPDPAYSDTPEALRAARDTFERVKLLLAGRAQRDARLAELKAANTACR